MTKILKAIEDFKREMRAESRALKTSVDACKSATDGFRLALADIRQLRTDVQMVQEVCNELEKKNDWLREQLYKTQTEVQNLDQYSRMNNVEIKGIPKGNGKQATEIAKSIGILVNVPLEETDLDICHAVLAHGNDSENIIIRFVTRKKLK